MAVLSLEECPHCGEKVAAWTVAEHVRRDDPLSFQVFAVCPGCENGLVAAVTSARRPGDTPHAYAGNLARAEGFTVTSVMPRLERPVPPAFLPGNIGGWYVQAADDLRRKTGDKDFHVVAMLCRKMLESALKRIEPEEAGALHNRINRLAAKNMITPAMREWAHDIRLLGNDSVHDEGPVDASSARELLQFTELFLTYLFTLPGMIRERRQARFQ